MNKYKILIIEDENNIKNFVKTILETNDYQVIDAKNGNEGKQLFMSHSPQLIILDLGLPDMDGLEFIKNIRKDSSIPIIVLSARTEENDKVMALDYGANDYVTKPFGTAELLARVRSALRNYSTYYSENNSEKGVITINDLKIDLENRKIFLSNEEIKLTQTEYNIVLLLSCQAGKVMTYSEIIKQIWQWNDQGSIKKLQVNMANIRRKLKEKPGENKYISNELGIGYRMINNKE